MVSHNGNRNQYNYLQTKTVSAKETAQHTFSQEATQF